VEASSYYNVFPLIEIWMSILYIQNETYKEEIIYLYMLTKKSNLQRGNNRLVHVNFHQKVPPRRKDRPEGFPSIKIHLQQLSSKKQFVA
jgi:hypothetical protein